MEALREAITIERDTMGGRAIELPRPRALIGTAGMRHVERREEWLEATTQLVTASPRRPQTLARQKLLNIAARRVLPEHAPAPQLRRAILPETDRPQVSLVRSLIRDDEGTGEAVVSAITSITPGTDATPAIGIDPTITLPAGHDALAIWVGDAPSYSAIWVSLYVNVNGTTRRYETTANRMTIVQASPGARVAINAAYRVGSTTTEVTWSGTIDVATFITPEELPAPASVTGNANCDLAALPLWTPGDPHIRLASENSAFVIDAEATNRVYYVAERDPELTYAKVRAIRVPANKDVTVHCRYRDIALACLPADGDPVTSITAPAGAWIGGNPIIYTPAFTVVDTVNVTSAAELATALDTAADGDDIVLAAGTYDMSAAGDRINSTNYAATAFTKTIRLRGGTGDMADVIIGGYGVQIILASITPQWIIQAVTFDLDSVTAAGSAAMDVGGNVRLHLCTINGPPTSTTIPLFSCRGQAYAATVYASLCTFTAPTDDLVDCSQTANAVLILVGCSIDGDGPDSNDQMLTAHTSGTLRAYNCHFSDASTTGSASNVSPDSTGSIYLYWCVCEAASIANAVGITLNQIALIHGCYFGAVGAFSLRQGGCVDSEIWQKAASGTLIQVAGSGSAWGGACVFLGCRLVAYTNSFCRCFEVSGTATLRVKGCWIEARGTSGSEWALQTSGSPSAGSTAHFVNCTIKCHSASTLFTLGSSTNLVVTLQNCIFYGSTTYSINASGTTTNVATGCYFAVSAAPTNFTTRFTTTTGTTFDATAPALEADGSPTESGNCDGTGLDLSFYASLDAYGRTLLLDATPVRGAIARPDIVGDPLVIPSNW